MKSKADRTIDKMATLLEGALADVPASERATRIDAFEKACLGFRGRATSSER
jgi:hypothetical protein